MPQDGTQHEYNKREQSEPSCNNFDKEGAPNYYTTRSSHMFFKPYHHISLSKNELDVSMDNVTHIFLKTINWSHQPTMDRPTMDRAIFSHDANNKLRRMPF